MQTNTQRTRMLVTMIACAATAGFATTAQAGDSARTKPHYHSVVVQYSDLDLNGVAGNEVLYARLSAAAERACGNDPHARDLQRRMQYRACYDSALSRAVDKVGSRELQALHTMGDTHNVG
ncbi:MAG: UrcA family protein [Proteobacteria bacterium]|nr:UrcA family protein [Pseudomonadota bacterium]